MILPYLKQLMYPVQEAEEVGKTVIEAFPDSPMAGEYRALAKTLLEVCGVAVC